MVRKKVVSRPPGDQPGETDPKKKTPARTTSSLVRVPNPVGVLDAFQTCPTCGAVATLINRAARRHARRKGADAPNRVIRHHPGCRMWLQVVARRRARGWTS